MGRRCYTTSARFFRNSDLEIPVRWMPADPDKKPLPFPSRICSIDWMAEKHEKEGVGEVWNTDRTFINDRKPRMVEGNGHVCGTEDEHRNGEILDLSRPLMKYGPSGIPLCCDPNRREDQMRISTATISHHIGSDPYRYPSSIATGTHTRTIRSDPRRVSMCQCWYFSITAHSEVLRVSHLRIGVTTPCHSINSDPRTSVSRVSVTTPCHYTASVVCDPLKAECPLALLTWADHYCDVQLPVFDDSVDPAPEGWRQWEVKPNTNYEFRWNYVLGSGVAGEVELYRGFTCGDKVGIDTEPLTGNSGTVGFSTGEYDRVFARIVGPFSDTSEDIFRCGVFQV